MPAISGRSAQRGRVSLDRVREVEHQVRPGARDHLLHLVDDLLPFRGAGGGALRLVQAVVGLAAVAGVVPDVPRPAGQDGQHEVRVAQRVPVPHRDLEALVAVGRDRVVGGRVVQHLQVQLDADLLEVGLDDLERPLAVGVLDVGRHDHRVRHRVAVGHPHAARPHLVPGLVQQLARLGQAERGGLDRRVIPVPRRGRDDRRPGLGRGRAGMSSRWPAGRSRRRTPAAAAGSAVPCGWPPAAGWS